MGKLSRTKGHSFERQVALWFQEAGFPDCRRQLEYHVKDAFGVDLQGTGPFMVQCKRGRTYAPITAIEEVNVEDAGDRRWQRREITPEFAVIEPAFACPILITKADKKPAMAVLPAEEFFKLIRQVYGAEIDLNGVINLTPPKGEAVYWGDPD